MVCQVCSGSQSIMSICGVILNGFVLDAIITITITIMIMNLKHHSVYSAKIQDVGVGQQLKFNGYWTVTYSNTVRMQTLVKVIQSLCKFLIVVYISQINSSSPSMSSSRRSITLIKDLANKLLINLGHSQEQSQVITDVLMYAELRGNNQGIIKLITGACMSMNNVHLQSSSTSISIPLSSSSSSLSSRKSSSSIIFVAVLRLLHLP